MIGIGKLSKELNIDTHLLREWEKRDWLGDVLKDPEQNNQRVYSDEQVERIKFIWDIIQEQRKKGFKRTDIKEVEAKLLEHFGGMVQPVETNIAVRPGSMEQMIEIIQMQNKKIDHLESIVTQQDKLLPGNLERLKEVQEELKASKKREENQQEMMNEMNEKLQQAVDTMNEMEKQQKEVQEKKSFWSKIFGGK